jgi:hypothetical protein
VVLCAIKNLSPHALQKKLFLHEYIFLSMKSGGGGDGSGAIFMLVNTFWKNISMSQ